MRNWISVRRVLQPGSAENLSTRVSFIGDGAFRTVLSLYSGGYLLTTHHVGRLRFWEVPNPRLPLPARRALFAERYEVRTKPQILDPGLSSKLYEMIHDWTENVIITDSFFRFR